MKNLNSCNKLPTLDGWRAIAISLVLFSHGSESIQNVSNTYVFLNLSIIKTFGLLGVKLFFGLSGFLITNRLINEEKIYGVISLKFFYIRRSFRILPASILFLIVTGLLSLNGIINITLYRWYRTFLFLSNYTTADNSWYLGHFWSLAVEEHFYFIWPGFFLFLSCNRKRIFFILATAALVFLWRAIDFKFHITASTPAIFWGRTDIQADSILWGVLIAFIYDNNLWNKRLVLLFSFKYSLTIILIILFGFEFLPNFDWKINFILLTIKAIVIPLVIIGSVINNLSLFSRILESYLFRKIGALSYSIYLWQQLFLVWNEHRNPSFSFLQYFPYNYLATLICAALCMILVEKPCINLGKKIVRLIKIKSNQCELLKRKNTRTLVS